MVKADGYIVEGEQHPRIETDVISLEDLTGKELASVVDIAAVVFEVGACQRISCYDGQARPKRNVMLVVKTKKMITIGLWSEYETLLNEQEGKGVMIRNVQLRDYAGKLQLSTTPNTIITLGGDHEQLQELTDWFEAEGCLSNFE